MYIDRKTGERVIHQPDCEYLPDMSDNAARQLKEAIEQSNSQSLLLSDEEICKTICGDYKGCGERGKTNPDCTAFDDASEVQKRLLKHLEELGIVYVEAQI